MFLVNHTLTGIALGLTIDDPLLLAPASVASHLALDVVPHFGIAEAKNANFHVKSFIIVGSIDFAVSIAVTIGACLLWPQRALNLLIGIAGACLPDLTYIPAIAFGKKGKLWLYKHVPGYEAMIRFFGRIQWYEKTPGLITEGLWLGLMLWLLRGLLPIS